LRSLQYGLGWARTNLGVEIQKNFMIVLRFKREFDVTGVLVAALGHMVFVVVITDDSCKVDVIGTSTAGRGENRARMVMSTPGLMTEVPMQIALAARMPPLNSQDGRANSSLSPP